jgi:uncharacterized phage-like protein YoqJ
MELGQQTTHAALTGHRPAAGGQARLFGGWREYSRQAFSPYYDRLRETLRGVVDEMLEIHQHLTLHSGMALGVDTIWADVIAQARDEHPDRIRFVADIPTENQSQRWLPESSAKWADLIAKADQVNVYADAYAPGVEGIRNRGMVVGADTVIVVADDKPSGSRRAMFDAIKGGARLIRFDPMVFADETQDVAARRRGADEQPARPADPATVKATPARVFEPRKIAETPRDPPPPANGARPVKPGEPESEPDPALASLMAGTPVAARVLEAIATDQGGTAMLVDLGDGKSRPAIVAPGKGAAKVGQHIELTSQNVGVGRGGGKFFIGFRHNPEPVNVVPNPKSPVILEHDVQLVSWLMAVDRLDQRIAQMAKAGVDSGLISRAVAPVGLARIAIDAIDTPTSRQALTSSLEALARPRITELAKYIPGADAEAIIASLVGEAASEAEGARAMVEDFTKAHPGARPLTSINPLVSMDKAIGDGLRLYGAYIGEDGSRVIARFPFKQVGREDLAARLDAPRDWEDRPLRSLGGVPGAGWLRNRVFEEDWPGIEAAFAKMFDVYAAEAEAAGLPARDQDALAAAEFAKDAATARAILEHLDDQGLPFQIRPNGLRIDAVIERAGRLPVAIRLIDPQTPQYVGQVSQGRIATVVDESTTNRQRPTTTQALASVKVGLDPVALAPGNVTFRKDAREVGIDGAVIRTGVVRGLIRTPSPLEAWDQTHKTPDDQLPIKYPEVASLREGRAADRAARRELWFTEQVAVAMRTVVGGVKLDDLIEAAERLHAAGAEHILPPELVSFDDHLAALQRTLWQRIANPIPGEDVHATFDRWMGENLVQGETGDPAAWTVDIDNVARYTGQNIYAVSADLAEYLSESTPPATPLRTRLLGENARRATWLDRMTKFNPDTASVYDLASARDEVDEFGPKAVMARVALEIHDTLDAQGVKDIVVELDEAGVFQWSGAKTVVNSKGSQAQRVVGQIGKVFEMGTLGEVYRTSLLTGDTEMVVPGYTASVAGGPGSFYERMRLTSYADQIVAAVRDQVTDDLFHTRFFGGAHRVDSSSALTRVLTNQYDVRLPGDYLSSVAQDEGELARREIIVGEYARRVRMPEGVSDSFAQVWRAGYDGSSAQAASRYRTDFTDLGMRTPAILDTRGEGGFLDGAYTNDSDPGRLRLLAAAVDVDDRGRVRIDPGRARQMIEAGHKATDSNLVKLLDRDIAHDAMDRRRMAKANVLTANSQTTPTYAAQIALRGWTMEDGFVVSRAFAEANGVLDPETGENRPLVVGDKLSDSHGNKGVIAYVAGAETSPDEYVEALFAANPELGVVYSPFGPLSRFNGGVVHEAVNSEAGGIRRLTLPGGQQAASSAAAATMGPLRFIVSHMTVDAGTRAYGEDYEPAENDDTSPAEQSNRPTALFSAVANKPVSIGRAFSAQAAWVLSAKGADKIAAELYADKNLQLSKAAEYLQMVGVSLKTDGSLALIDHDALAGMSTEQIAQARGERRTVNPLDGGSFAEAFGQYGGDMIVPAGWDLEFPNALAREDEARPAPRRLVTLDDNSQLLPVIPAALRVGRDGMAHEYSQKYQIIFDQVQAHAAAEAIEDPQIRAGAQALARNRARGAWSTLTNLMVDREVASKQGIFRKGLLGANPQHSANAVWSADPRLDLDEIAVGPQLATSLGLADHRQTEDDGPNQRVLIYRDPVQHDGGVRYMKVRIDPDIKGVRINPVMVKSFDGDFDGDTVGLIRLTGQAAFEQAVEKFDVSANLLDRRSDAPSRLAGQVDQTINPLNLHIDADLTIGEKLAGPQPDLEGLDLGLWREQINRALWDGQIDGPEGLESLNHWAHTALNSADARLGLRFDNPQTYLESVKAVVVDTGAKGNPGKLATFAQYVADGRPAPPEAMTEALRAANDLWGLDQDGDQRDWGAIADEGVNAALVVKKAVGLAGAKQYQAARALRGKGPEAMTAALGLSAAVNQGLLQAKHDPVQAMSLFADVQTGVAMLWDGDLPNWRGGRWRQANGVGRQRTPASVDQWVDAAKMVFTDRMGLNVSENVIRQVADALATDGDMNSITAERGAPLDQIAYVEAARSRPLSVMAPLLDVAAKGGNLYQGPHAMFAPPAIRKTRQLDSEVLEPEAIVDATATADGPRRADEGRRYSDAEARRAQREELFNPTDPAKATYKLVEVPGGAKRMVALNIEGVEPETLGGVVGEDVRVAHDGSWIGPEASVSGRTTLEGGAWVVGAAWVADSHLVGSRVEGQADVANCKLCETYVGENARLARVVAPFSAKAGAGQVTFTGNSKTYMVSIDRSEGDVWVGGEASISGRMHKMNGKAPARIIGAGGYDNPDSAPTYKVQDGWMVAVDIPGVEAGALGAQVFGSSRVQHDGSWADKGSVIVDSQLSGAAVSDSYVAESRLTGATVTGCVVDKTTLRRWTATRVQLEQCVLDTGSSAGVDKDEHGLSQVRTRGRGGVSVVNSEIARLTLDAGAGPVELDGVRVNAPITLDAGQWTDATVRQALTGGAETPAPAMAGLAV